MTQTQPQWSPPPQQPMGWGGPGYGGPPARPGGVTFAAIFLIVMGVIVTLLSLLAFIGGAALGGLGQGFGVFGGIVAVLGVILLVVGVLHIASGIGSLQGKGWARWTGVVIAIIMAILLVLGAITSLTAPPTTGVPGAPETAGANIMSVIINVILAVLYALAAWALIKATAYFAWRR